MSRLVSGEAGAFEGADRALRPQTLAEFVGQEACKANLKVFIDAARGRGQALDHVLLFGPPGLGKTTLAQIVARELGVNFRATAGPILAKAGDLAAILTNLEPRDVLFIDEIHRLPPQVEEVLYPAMEDHVLDLIIGEGPSARSVRIDLAPFTLVAATTRAGLLATPLRDRFGIPLRLEFYTPAELQLVLGHGARKMGIDLTRDGAAEIAGRARGTPRVAGRLLRRVRDFAEAESASAIDRAVAGRALARLEVDEAGLDSLDRRYLRALIETYGGGPVGAETLAAALAEARDAIEDVIEPYLLQQGFVLRTPRGRVAGAKAYLHLGLPTPAKPAQPTLFEEAVMDGPTAGRFEGAEHRLPVRVYYEDTDFTGVVYHANYARYFERGRSDFLRLAGLDHTALLALPTPLAFTITRLALDYLRPARIDDALEVRTVFEAARGARFAILQRLWRGEELLCSGEVQAACVDLTGRPRRLPAELATRLKPYVADRA